MTSIQKFLSFFGAVTSRRARDTARARCLQLAVDCAWLRDVIRHHCLIEKAFLDFEAAQDIDAKHGALRLLMELLNAHSIAERTVIFPALAIGAHKASFAAAHAEEAELAAHMAATAPLHIQSEGFASQLDALRKAVQFHFYQEESSWFPRLFKVAEEEFNRQLSANYVAEFERHIRRRDPV